MFFKSQKRIYLDHAASTPLSAEVFSSMTKAFQMTYGNPSALHREGVAAATLLETSRKAVASCIGAHADEVVFTSGATESDVWALEGVALHAKTLHAVPHIVISAVEHSAIIETARIMEKRGAITLDIIPVDIDGQVAIKTIRSVLKPETVLVSVILANNEIGTIIPIHEIAKELRHWKKVHDRSQTSYPLLHTDAAQALNYIQLRVEKLGVDLMTLNASKLYGPKGVGTLYVKRGTPITPFMTGGHQEYGMRAGTENVPLIVGMASAVQQADILRSSETARLTLLREYGFSELQKIIPQLIINGDRDSRLANNINVTIPGYASELLVTYLDQMGIAVSSQSACTSDTGEASHVIAAIRAAQGAQLDSELGSLRITLGRSTRKADIDALIRALVKIFEIQKIR